MSRTRTTSPLVELARDEADTAASTAPARRHEVLGILCAAATVLLALALWSYDARGGENWIGPAGSAMAGLLATAFGLTAWVLPFELGLLTVRLFRGAPRDSLGVARAASTFVVVLIGCALLHLSVREQVVLGGHLPGGLLGEVVGEVLRSILGLAGAYVVAVSVLLVTIVLRTSLSLVALYRGLATRTKGASSKVAEGARSIVGAWREARELERTEREAQRLRDAPKIVLDPDAPETDDTADEEDVEEDDAEARELADASEEDAPQDDAPEDEPLAAAPPPLPAPEPPKKKSVRPPKPAEVEPPPPQAKRSAPAPASKQPALGPTIVAPKNAPIDPNAPVRSKDTVIVPHDTKEFVLPPTSLLDAIKEVEVEIDERQLTATAVKLVEKLDAYGVQGRVDEIHPGPVVTMYELEPASGTKVSKIAGLADDLAMALAAQKVRIVAPIPGKARVGFELPNPKRQTVSLRQILEDERWKTTKHALPMALGKDIAGQPVYVDMAKMPHLLVAGATGAGKSVGLNVMITSLLQKRTPEEVRLLMIDPKVVELAVFDGIPHLLLPVVTDMKKASLALRWAVDEMERRYQLFADAGAKNLVTYNERVEKVLRGEMAPEALAPRRAGKVKAVGPEGEEVLLNPDDETPDALAELPTKLPYIVCVVDEFADLMMTAAKDVEAAIARLAQKARAAGIHVILATQRPSVDVITGMIKANFPARIAFKVAQRQDSQTILGQNGAEHLLGMGDMLMIPPGAADLKRVHCAYISEEEVKAVTDFLRAQGKPEYKEAEILKPRDDEDGEGGGTGAGATGSDDPLYDRAVAIVAQAGYCSISHLQRQLNLGYNKAAKLVEQMEKEGVVGPPSGKAGGRREVLVQPM